jgi:hypothetical protein
MLNSEINYAEAGRKGAEARNQRDEARAQHWAQYFQGMRNLERTNDRQRAEQLYRDAYKEARTIPAYPL